MAGRVIWVLVVLGVLSFLSCTGDSYTDTGTCDRPEECSSSLGGVAHLSCSGGTCSCSKPGYVPCCPDGTTDCSTDLMGCLPEWICSELKVECEWDGDCLGPPDPRCGVARCKEGRCKPEILGGEPIPNQFPGDCKMNVCSIEGEVVVWADPSDLPDDGNPCTLDTCEGDAPVNTNMPKKAPCPGGIQGFCDSGKCWECSDTLDFKCPSKSFCYYDKCVPYSCINGVTDGQESSTDCGGPICDTCGWPGTCKQNSDCTSGVCGGGVCQKPTHTDGVKNGDETGVDCGYPGGPLHTCKDGEGCTSSSYCVSAVCYLGVCQAAACTDATQNGAETGIDCGGECSPCQN
jgi:hypothetical protein